MGSLASEGKEQIQQVAIGEVKPNEQQPRQYFDEEKLSELAQSIKQNGILQPLLVEKVAGNYLLIAGERRLRAAQLAGLNQVPVVVKQFNAEQKLEVALIENIQREDLKPIEQANTYAQLISLLNLSHEELANRIGKSRSAVTNTLRLLQLPAPIQEALEQGKMSAGHARALLSLENQPELQQKLSQMIIEEEISVRETEERAKTMVQTSHKSSSSKPKTTRSAQILHTEKKLMENLGVKLQIKGDEHRGVIAIRYHSQEKLNRIIALLEHSDKEE
nr:ParB/RepB/Spo0J family partition protein [Entomospira culicis]